ncbi:MAG: fibronectin type III domain-containing protein, partial [Ginsengibacter sp.]
MKKNKTKLFIIVGVVIILLASAFVFFNYHSVAINSVVLSSPENYAFQEKIDVETDKPSSLYVSYWKDGSTEKFRTVNTLKGRQHSLNLLLLETGTTYHYQVIIDQIMDVPSKIFSFKTRTQSPWLVHNWVKDDNPHDATTLGDGMIMLCNARLPGYIAMVDGKGTIRWYWQTDAIGVRAATLTPKGTILAMLRPPMKDV